MKTTRYRIAKLGAGALVLVVLFTMLAGASFAAGPITTTYQVTITNLTPGQPFAPPVLATHRGRVSLFDVGQPASYQIKESAENGNNGPLVAALSANPFVYDVQTGGAPIVSPNDPGGTGLPSSATYTIETERRSRFLSVAAMLICTNDGFTGVSRLPLPARTGSSLSVYVPAYDAGTEINTEDFADLVPPCPAMTGVPSDAPGSGTSNPALAEGGVVSLHAGVTGVADLIPAIHDWSGPVAKITVTRIN